VDSQERNQKFARAIAATYPLLSDTQKSVAKQYGVLNWVLRFANRTTFVIDKDGIIRHIDKGSAALDPANAHQACSLLEHGK
jgi:peroxiredoxin Q/BCP